MEKIDDHDRVFLHSRRKTVHLQRVREVLRRQVQPSGPRSDPLQHEAVRLLALQQGLRAQVVPLQARGVFVHEDAGGEEREAVDRKFIRRSCRGC